MPRIPIHPGELLAEELNVLSMRSVDMARQLHVPTNRVNQIIAGKRSITTDTALRLGKLFGTGPYYWLNLQILYEIDKAEMACNNVALQNIRPLQTASVSGW